jgi:RsiW-degrading membrane proteinase PrsW (M82 family)
MINENDIQRLIDQGEKRSRVYRTTAFFWFFALLFWFIANYNEVVEFAFISGVCSLAGFSTFIFWLDWKQLQGNADS